MEVCTKVSADAAHRRVVSRRQSKLKMTIEPTEEHAHVESHVGDVDLDNAASSPTNFHETTEHLHEFAQRASDSADTLSGPDSHAHAIPQPSSEYAISPRVSTVGTDDSHHGGAHWEQLDR